MFCKLVTLVVIGYGLYRAYGWIAESDHIFASFVREWIWADDRRRSFVNKTAPK